MRVGISGGTGFLGSSLRVALLQQGHETVFTSRNHPEAIPWNPMQDLLPLEAIQDTSAFVHLVGEPLLGRWTQAKKERIWNSRVTSTGHVVGRLEAMKKRGLPLPEVLVLGSAIGIYGDTGDVPADESAPPGGGFLADLGCAWEEAALKASHLGVRVVAVRTGLVLDPRHGLLKNMLLPFKLGLGGRLGPGTQWMSWIHRDDWVGLLLWCLQTQVQGPVNLVAPESVQNREFTTTLASALSRPALVPVPAFALRLLLGEMSQAALESQRIVPRVAMQGGYRFAYPNLRGALLNLFQD